MDIIEDSIKKDVDTDFINYNTAIQEFAYIITVELERNIQRALQNNKKYMILYTYNRNQRYKSYNMYYLIISSYNYATKHEGQTVLGILQTNPYLKMYNIEHYYNVRTKKNELKVVFKVETDIERIKRLEKRDQKKLKNTKDNDRNQY